MVDFLLKILLIRKQFYILPDYILTFKSIIERGFWTFKISGFTRCLFLVHICKNIEPDSVQIDKVASCKNLKDVKHLRLDIKNEITEKYKKLYKVK